MKVDPVLDLYKPKEGVPEPEFPFPDDNYFYKVMEVDHICDRCGSKMEKQDENRFLEKVFNEKIRCPDCGGHLEAGVFFNWD